MRSSGFPKAVMDPDPQGHGTEQAGHVSHKILFSAGALQRKQEVFKCYKDYFNLVKVI